MDYATKRTSGRILILICIIWVTSILISSSHLFPVFRDKRGRPPGQCHLIGNVPYTIISTVGAFYIPLIVMCIIYWKIFQAAKFRIRRKAFNANQSPPLVQTTLINAASTRTVPAMLNHQAEGTPSPSSNHARLLSKVNKSRSFSPSEFRKVPRNVSQSVNHHLKDIDTDNQSNHSSNNKQNLNQKPLKPPRKAFFSLLKKDKETVVTVVKKTSLSSTNNRFNKDYEEGQHELEVLSSVSSDRRLINSSFDNNNTNSPIHTVNNPLDDSVRSSSNPLNVTETPTFKPICTTILTDGSLTPSQSNNATLVARSPVTAMRKKIDIKRERKATKVLGVVMGCFILCWLPFFIEETICGIFHLTINEKIISVLTWLGYLNSLLNPVIYTIFAPDFRQAFGKILFGKYRNRRRRLKK